MNAKGYSEATYMAIKNGVKPAEALKRLTAILARHGHVALYSRILKSLEVRLDQELLKDAAHITVAKKGDIAKYKKEIAAFEKEYALSDEEVTIDESVIGGYVLEGKGVRVDASYKSSLMSIYKNLVA